MSRYVMIERESYRECGVGREVEREKWRDRLNEIEVKRVQKQEDGQIRRGTHSVE